MRRVNKANGATIDFLWVYDALRNRKRLGELQGPWPRNFVYDAFGRLAHIGIPFGRRCHVNADWSRSAASYEFQAAAVADFHSAIARMRCRWMAMAD